MHPLVRDLFKRFVIVGRDYPVGPPYVRSKAAEAFRKNADIVDDVELKRAVARGRWMVKELIGVIRLKKYRTLKQRYSAEKSIDPVEAAAVLAKKEFGV